MNENKNIYPQILKSMGLFGGVQIIQVLSTILRGKFVAMLLGTTGIGINAILNSTITLIVQCCSLGLNFSAVRDISKAHSNAKYEQLQHVIIIVRRWILFCVFLGVLITCLSAKWLSLFSFKNTNYTSVFVFSSLAVVFNILNIANVAILQGQQKLNIIAKVTLLSALLGAITCIPCYYIWKINGILPALIVSSAVSFFISSFYSTKTPYIKSDLTFKKTVEEGSGMVKLGVTMMVVGFIGTIANYVFNSYISKHGSISDVGLYSAGLSITNQYIGVVFTAMAVGYFPKLSSVSNDREKVNEIVNSQSEIVILVSAPLLIIMMLSAPLLIKVLLSSEFLIITDFIYWAAFAMFFKAASFSMGYISFAKGDKKTFLILEGVFGNGLILISNIIGYRLGGITGIAIGTLACYIIYMILISVVIRKLYNFSIKLDFIFMFLKLGALLLGVLLSVLFLSKVMTIVLGTLLLAVTLFYCFKELNKRILLKTMILSKIRK
jgi:O-antigen/teichoic acid export membrane protein